ncbi:MAG TPA: cobalamin-dependent protein [Terracidiphilus sp.]|nr:cobalamin-dependent protein [Terracidiphilus sp.]HEV2398052.1 cobalamin-dependent protein [Candidatus Sulfotelmatobacter sp.]
MNALLVYPRFPDTYWSFRYALSFQGKRAAQPPLGLMTIAALLPASWNKRLIDTNVERLKDSALAWADVVLLSGMHVQQQDLISIVRRCHARGIRTVVGGPIASSMEPTALETDCVVIGEAENLIATLARDLESDSMHPVYRAEGYPLMEHSPLPDLSLIRLSR